MANIVGVAMGSISDWPTMKLACQQLDNLEISYEKHVISAHRMPDELQAFGKSARNKGLKVIIAGAGGAAHLPGMIAANTTLPVIGVPIKTRTLNGVDSLLSIVQMPFGAPVATVSIGESGAKNAALLAAQILGVEDQSIQQKLLDLKHEQRVEAKNSEQQFD
ncbi:MAG: 5-(carboxyamino)imidazole ribonucleotide mutase [Lentilactobacillus hilgardii]|uniref:N5-carboxyaminoimidazole ribonucleotide mutase n=1 Tax=Lentilactobacillus hilgardii TaxID=1588 RepID=A0A6P1ECJ7_LENHI|nr:5-(carboxyamino)imidazole ribonucleotide mutase [Lentilactobacillus hilgardii]MBZ2201240.1 5-(carboxyamino)imidazole ribonucleotide mutase [Lentilactobacillus hilgardii]MBZ2205360.1 5-(carboxyamino)imidazole ribonucleotide mutase [Lentilactobacillus hilgardii]MCT3392455.1 5-(carboxyamino)imidazole ribonucleotide mutase [Lentilactobacillus hilgardii]QHB53335.1 5-(carboxyamino)imidazole ribonucleotide mutase [Lentilactobacillus hilgardii]